MSSSARFHTPSVREEFVYSAVYFPLSWNQGTKVAPSAGVFFNALEVLAYNCIDGNTNCGIVGRSFGWMNTIKEVEKNFFENLESKKFLL